MKKEEEKVTKCVICKRKLKNPVSISKSMGPVCRKRYNEEINKKRNRRLF